MMKLHIKISGLCNRNKKVFFYAVLGGTQESKPTCKGDCVHTSCSPAAQQIHIHLACAGMDLCFLGNISTIAPKYQGTCQGKLNVEQGR